MFWEAPKVCQLQVQRNLVSKIALKSDQNIVLDVGIYTMKEGAICKRKIISLNVTYTHLLNSEITMCYKIL